MVFQSLTSPGKETYEPGEDIELDERDDMLNKGWPAMSFIENKLGGDPTNWWAPNHACVIAMLNTCGMRVVSNPGHEIYIAQPDPSLDAVAQSWNRTEYLSAVGQSWNNDLARKVGRNYAEPESK